MIFEILYKTLIVAKPFRIRFNQVDGFIRVYDTSRYLALFDAIYNKMRYLTSQKRSHIFVLNITNNQNWFLRFFASIT